MDISERVVSTMEPPLLELGGLASKTPDCISLGQGAPNYSPDTEFMEKYYYGDLPDYIHRYSQDPGIDELRVEIAGKLSKDNKINARYDEIVVTPGANQAFINILMTICDPGDNIVLLGPYYFNHKMACTLLGVNAIEVGLKSDFSIDHDRLQKTIMGNDIRAIVLVNPGNPTGAVHNRDDLNIIAECINEKDIMLIADETYEYFTYDSKHISAASNDELKDKTITIHSFSKTFGIPGWRIGYYHAEKSIIDHSLKVQDTTIICAPVPSQFLGIQLLRYREPMIEKHKKYLENNFKLANDLIEEVKWLENRPSRGAYYLFPEQTTGTSSMKLTRELIENNKVYIVPGDVFGESGRMHFRISFANVSENDLHLAFNRLKSI